MASYADVKNNAIDLATMIVADTCGQFSARTIELARAFLANELELKYQEPDSDYTWSRGMMLNARHGLLHDLSAAAADDCDDGPVRTLTPRQERAYNERRANTGASR